MSISTAYYSNIASKAAMYEEITALCLLYVIIINYNMMAEGWVAN